MITFNSPATGEPLSIPEPLPAGWRLSATGTRFIRTVQDCWLTVSHTGRLGSKAWEWELDGADGGEGAVGGASHNPSTSHPDAHAAMAAADAWARG